MLKVTIDGSDMRTMARELGQTRKRLGRATVRALKRTATFWRKEFILMARQSYTLKSGRVRRAIRLSLPSATATGEKYEAVFKISGAPVALQDFQLSTTRKGVSVNVKRSTGRKQIRHAFQIRKINWSRGLGRSGAQSSHGSMGRVSLIRAQEGGKRAARYPVESIGYGPSVAGMGRAMRVKYGYRLRRRARRFFIQRWEQEVRYEMKKLVK